MGLGDAPTNGLYVREGRDAAAAYSAAATITLATNPTDILTLSGSATKKVRIKRVFISGIQTTAGQRIFLLIKRTAVNTAGTSSAVTAALRDSTTAAPTAVVTAYTANPSGLGAGATVASRHVPLGVTTSSTNNATEINLDGLVLNSATEFLAVNLDAVATAGGVVAVTVEWTEGE